MIDKKNPVLLHYKQTMWVKILQPHFQTHYDTLYMNPHLQKLEKRGITLPEMFSHLQNYHDEKNQKKKEPGIFC